MLLVYWGLAGNPGGDLGDDEGDLLGDCDGEGVVGGVVAAAGLGLDGVEAADEVADRAPDEVQLSSSPRS